MPTGLSWQHHDRSANTATTEQGGASVILTVTGTGTPIPCPGRAGPGALVASGDTLLQFDAGRGTVLRLAEANISPADLTALFITHHHSDHMIDVADLLLTRWIRGGPMPFPVIVPAGPAAKILSKLIEFWEDDIAIRLSHGRRKNRPELDIVTFEPGLQQTVVWQLGDLSVRSVSGHHEPVLPAVAYRADASDGSVTISGDTRVCNPVMALARGCDVLLHEAMRTSAVLAAGMPHVAAYHADTIELGKAAQDAEVNTLVLTHLEPSPRNTDEEELFVDDVRAGGFKGELIVAKDLLSIDTSTTLD